MLFSAFIAAKPAGILMTTISESMTNDHRRCDELFSEAEALVAKGDWSAASAGFDAFHQALEHHFEMEESVLFPEFEQRTGQSMGPTQVMRMEHIQMRQLVKELLQAVQAK